MARSISSITVRRSAVASSAPKRCSRSVSLRALTSTMTSPMASSLRASRARMEKSSSRRAARRLERVCREKVTRCFTESAKPSQKMTIKKVSVQAVPEEEFPVHRRIRATSDPGRPAPSARSWIRRSYVSRVIPVDAFAAGGTWRYGSIRELWRLG